jgi:mRNA interferase YafQ
MKTVSQTTQFARDVKLTRKRGKDLGKLQAVVRLLADGVGLPRKCRDHALAGSWQPSRDCHLEADWILIYTADADALRLERTGSHSDLFAE